MAEGDRGDQLSPEIAAVVRAIARDMVKDELNGSANRRAPALRPPSKAAAEDRFISIKDVRARIGLSPATIYRLIRQGTFPDRVRLGGGAVRWKDSEVRAWMQAREHSAQRAPWAPPPAPPVTASRPVADQLLPAGRSGEAAAQVSAAAGLRPSAEAIPDDDIALRFPDWPEMMRRRTAAAYLDLTESAFIREVARGTLPRPIVLGGRESWNRQQIDKAIAKLLAVAPMAGSSRRPLA